MNPGMVHDGKAAMIEDGIAGSAGLFGTVEDISKLGKMFLNRIFLKKQTFSEMVKLQAEYNGLRRGLGWQLYSSENNNPARVLSKDSYGHNGFTGTSLWIDPTNKLVIVFLSNSVYFYNSKIEAEKFNDFRINLHQTVLNEVFYIESRLQE